MRQLIMKDFFLQKRTAYMYLAMGMLFFFYFDAMDQENMLSPMIPAFIIVYSFMNRSLHEDEKNNTLRLLLTLPVERALLVKAKYMSVLSVAVISTIILVGIAVATGAVSFADPVERQVHLLVMAACILCYTVILSVFLPITYKLGIIKAQTINRFIFFGFIALGTTFGALVNSLKSRFNLSGEPPAWLDRMGTFLEQMNPYVFFAALLAFSAVVYLGSMLMSIRFMERREVY
ncbi:MAG: family transporter protein [Paenibacillaceae bacterium]|jgi:ABC-type transport system involved in multi-copper enzyme maturation permease subunit|nr:family transporter protein [Paenibacillaceae bacterium]